LRGGSAAGCVHATFFSCLCSCFYVPPKVESAKAYKARLKRTALKLPEKVVRAAVRSIPKRARAVVAAKGENIDRD
jgi:hypothetical protein